MPRIPKGEYIDEEFVFKWIDLKRTLNSKPNQNILTVRRVGRGKEHAKPLPASSTWTMLEANDFHVQASRLVILRAGYPVADITTLVASRSLDLQTHSSARLQ